VALLNFAVILEQPSNFAALVESPKSLMATSGWVSRYSSKRVKCNFLKVESLEVLEKASEKAA
jgi:hypothetical protein